MATDTGILTQGTTIGISVDGLAYTQIGCMEKYTLERGSRSEIDTTCLTDLVKTTKRGIEETGTLNIDMFFDRGAGLTLAEASFESDDLYFFEIVTSDAVTTTFQGYVMKMPEQDGEIDGVLKGSMEISVQTKPVVA